MGLVFRAWDRISQQHVALKTGLRPDPEDVFRLKREFRSFARVAHPNLVRLYEMVADNDQCFFTMELVDEGLPLPEHVRTRAVSGAGPSEADRARRRVEAVRDCFRQLTLALMRVHVDGMVHRDVKPTNVLVDASGRVVLLDFGLFGGLETHLSMVSMRNTFVGTAAYMSPEQAWGRDLTPATDWYSFGVMLYESLTGRSPFGSANLVDLIDRTNLKVTLPDPVVDGCPADLAGLTMALLSPTPADRPGGDEILAALHAAGDAPAPALQSSQEEPRESSFVGRVAELARLGQAFDATIRGGVGVVTLDGPSGIGKTKLIEHFLAGLGAQDALVLRSRCYPYEAVPFGALDEAVDELSRHLAVQSADEVRAVLPLDTAALCTVFPVLSRIDLPDRKVGTSPDAAPHELRRRGFLALAELIGRLARHRPLIIWIEDLQWSDLDSEPLLRELLRSPDARRVLWIFTYRSEDRFESAVIESVEGLLDQLPNIERKSLHLGPLTPDECHALMTAIAPEVKLSERAAEAITAASGGSPFLLSQMVRYGRSESAGPGADFGAALAKRVAALPDAARRLVETVVYAAGPLDRRLAMEASGLQTFDPDLVASLERERLLRTTQVAGEIALEVYHARIRESIEAQLSTDIARARHGDIARTLERQAHADVYALFTHFRAAGDAHAAAPYAVRAGDQAAAQLAFDQAAHFYQSALDLDPESIDPFFVLSRLGEALAHAGRGGEAAIAYAKAAGLASKSSRETEAMTLQCQSAEQYLLSGRLEDGTRSLRPLFARLGVHWPDTTGEAVRGTLARLPRLAVHYALFRPREDSAVPEEAQLTIDVCQTAAKGLVVVDPIRAAYFSVRGLMTALRTGDLRRTGRALSAVGVALIPVGGPISSWADHMLRRSVAIGEETGDPYLRAVASICAAEAHFVHGRWADMLANCDRGTELLRASCRGVRWECDVGDMAALRALEELGRIPELNERLPRLLEEADELDDRYAQVTFSLYQGFWLIAAGEAERGRTTARTGLRRWDQPAEHLQHLYGLRIEAFCDIDGGDPGGAWQRVEQTWPTIENANLLRHPMLRTDAYMLRACTALARADAGHDKAAMLRDAERSAKVLARAGRDDSKAGAALMRAGIAHRRGESERVIDQLDEAVRLYVGAGMPLHASYARRRRGSIVGGDSGAASVAEADQAMRDRGIGDPERWLAIVAPGFFTGEQRAAAG